MEPVIHIRGVQKSFPGPQGRLPVLQDIDLDVAPAEFITIVGRRQEHTAAHPLRAGDGG